MRTLVLAPHADDEALGCGGLICRRIKEGHGVDVVVASISTVHQAGDRLKATADVRTRELEEAARRLGICRPQVMFEGYENRLDTLPMIELITALDAILGETAYDEVLLPYPSHHQDHRLLYDAGFAALREKGGGHYPSLIALYETPYVGWAPREILGGKYYVDITEYIDGKLHALAAYESQVPPAPHPVSLDATRTLAAMRGIECGRKFAELYYVIKMVS